MAEQVNRKALTDALQDLRKMRRSVRLRTEEDPEVIVNILNTILKEAITLRSYDSGRIGRNAVREIRDIRRDLIAGQVNPGGNRTGEFVAKYSAVLDQIEQIDVESAPEENKIGSSVISSIAQNLPSADALTAALMTANPVLGYTTKIARDLLRSRRDAKAQVKMKQDERIAQLNKEQAEAEAQLAEFQEAGNEEGSKEVIERLDVIKEELINLARIWGDDRTSQIEAVVEQKETNDLLEKVSEDNEESSNNLEKISKLEEERTRKERSDKGKQRLKLREDEYEQGAFTAGSVGLKEDSAKESGLDLSQFGLMSGLGGAIGGIAAKIFTPFKWLFGFLAKGALVFGKAALIGGVLVSVVNGIGGFIDGLLNTAEVLGKDEGEEITLFDRFRAGQAGLIAGLLSPLNWLLKQVGLGFAEDETEIRDKVVQIQDNLISYVSNFFDNIGKFFSVENFEQNVVPAISAFVQSATTMMVEKVDEISEAVFGISVTDAIQLIRDKINEAIESITKFFTDMIDGVKNWATGTVESVEKGFDKSVGFVQDTAKGATETVSGWWNSAKEFVGLGEEAPTKTLKEALEESQSKQSNALIDSSRSLNGMIDDVAANRPSTIIAPNNVTNVNSQVMQNSTGSRNNDPSINRSRQRSQILKAG